LHGSAPDWSPRRRLSAPQRALLLVVPGRGNPAAHELPGRDAARRRLVRVRQPHPARVLTESGRGLLDLEPPDPGRLVDPRRCELPRDDPEPPMAWSELHADAALHLDDPGRAVPRPARLPSDHVRADLPVVRPLFRDALLRRGRGRRSPSLAAPVLDLWAPRG